MRRSRLMTVLLAVMIVCATSPHSSPAAAAPEAISAQIAVVLSGDLYILDAATGALTRLTDDGDNRDPSWDRTGTTVLFVKAPRGGAAVVWRWTAAKGLEQLFSASRGMVSPDGDSWAYPDLQQGSAPDQWPAPATTWLTERGMRGPVSPSASGVRWEPLAWSPDGRTLALASFTPTPPGPLSKDTVYQPGTTLWVTEGDPIQGKLRQLQMPAAFGEEPGVPDVAWFSPDGRFLTVGVGPGGPCSSCRADGLPFYAVPVDGGAPVALGGGLAVGTLSWASSSSFVVLSGPFGRWSYTNKHLVLTDTATGAQRQLTDDAMAADIAPAVSPDETLIAFARGHDPGDVVRGADAVNAAVASRRIWLVRPDGGLRPLDLGKAGWADDAPAWTPDGRWVIFVRYRPGGDAAELWAAPVTGGAAQRLATGVGPPPTQPGAGRDLVFRSSDYFAVQPLPAEQSVSRLAALGNGGSSSSASPIALLVVAGGLLLIAACALVGVEKRCAEIRERTPAWGPAPRERPGRRALPPAVPGRRRFRRRA